jgi:DNA-binding winged helix-turn-helix (wHTH) protein/TolB-like protein/Flp pilus assembly protein TadD
MMAKTPDPEIYEFEGFRVDVGNRRLMKGVDSDVPLTPKVFDTLLYLIRHRGAVIGKDELMREIWSDSVVEENNLNQNISTLRKVFGERPGDQRFIVTVAGLGYRFVPEVRVVSEPGPGIGETGIGNQVDKKQIQNNRRNHRLIAALMVLGLVTLCAVALYLHRLNKGSADRPVRTIAVLPFKPLVAEYRNEVLEFGMADALIAKLSDADEVAVRPLSAIRRYSSLEQDSLRAGRELGVESILDGTIQTWGNRIRVSAKLLRTSDGKQLWADQFDVISTDIFVVQDSISEKVATALKIRLGGREKKHSTESIEAYQLYMEGRYHIDKLTPSAIRAGIPYFQRAIEIDPRYALAYTRLSQAYGVLAISGEMPPSEAFPKAQAAAQKAIELDDMLSDAHDSLCMGMFWNGWDWSGAEKECLRGIQINPNSAESHGNYALLLSNTGRHAEALAESKRSRELNPLHLGQNAIEGQILLSAGRVDEALVQLQKTAQLEPNFWMPHFLAASVYIEKGMFAEAIAESRKEYELSGRNDIPFGAYALAKSGKQPEAKAALNELLKLSATRYVPPYNIAFIFNALDMPHDALEWLEKAYEQRDPKMTFLKVEPKWNNLRGEPRFIDLMKRMKFQ